MCTYSGNLHAAAARCPMSDLGLLGVVLVQGYPHAPGLVCRVTAARVRRPSGSCSRSSSKSTSSARSMRGKSLRRCVVFVLSLTCAFRPATAVGNWHVLGLFGHAKAKVEESTVRGVTQKDLIALFCDLRLVLPSALSGPPLKWLAAFNLCAQHKAQVLWRLCGDDGCGGCL
jgi:hypothetical protein